LIHGLFNIGAAAVFAISLILRKKTSRAGGRFIAALGYALMTYAAHLGGKMVDENRVGVDGTDGHPLSQDFVAALAESDLANDKPTRAVHDGVPILLVRRGDRLFAMAETCSHFGGPLSQGELVGDSSYVHFTTLNLLWRMAEWLMAQRYMRTLSGSESTRRTNRSARSVGDNVDIQRISKSVAEIRDHASIVGCQRVFRQSGNSSGWLACRYSFTKMPSLKPAPSYSLVRMQFWIAVNSLKGRPSGTQSPLGKHGATLRFEHIPNQQWHWMVGQDARI
jgi:Rieske [2Fe-2S] domain